jgi:Domain of unknown function (DUF4406)
MEQQLVQSQNTLVWYTPGHGDDCRFCYVAGPMTGYDAFNYPAFDAARDLLVSEAWNVINPADLDRINLDIDFSVMTGKEDLGHLSKKFARQDIASLLIAEAVFLLDGWQKSTGATNEAGIASMLGVPVYELSTRELVDVKVRFSNTPVAA